MEQVYYMRSRKCAKCYACSHVSHSGISLHYEEFLGVADLKSDFMVFRNSWNYVGNRAKASQATLRTILTVAGFSVYYRMFW